MGRIQGWQTLTLFLLAPCALASRLEELDLDLDFEPIEWDEAHSTLRAAVSAEADGDGSAFSIRDHASALAELNSSLGTPADDFDNAGVGCYCKEVESMSECLDNKHRSDPEKPSGPRFFHPGVLTSKPEEGPKNLCCKLDWTSLFSWVGWSYKRQDDLTRCMDEVREVPADSCCRLKDAHGSFGVRISKAKAESTMVNRGYSYDLRFYKSPPEISLEDIVSSRDHSGEEVELEHVREFVQSQLEDGGRFKGKLQCGGTHGSFDELFADKGTCQLRTGPSQQCCCHTASLIEATRCLPAEGAATQAEAQPVVLASKYSEYRSHGVRQGSLHDLPAPSEGRMASSIKGMADPLMEDIPDTVADETEMVWDWVKAPTQWKRTCVDTMQVPYVISKQKSKRVRNGQSCHKYGRGPRICRPRYRTKRWTEYSQGYSQKCSQWRWDRLCAAGEGIYVKQIDPGQCAPEPAQATDDKQLVLTDLGSLMFECPDDYESGNGGTQKFNAKCRCHKGDTCK